MMRSAAAAATVAALALVGTRVHAEPLAAETLFDDGVAAMKAGDFEQACPKIAESNRLERRPGTLFTLAECWARAGRIATAVARYREYLRTFSRMSADEKATQRGRDVAANQQLRKLEPRVPRLKIRLTGATSETIVRLNGAELGVPSLNVWLPVDPGAHTIVVRHRETEASQRVTVRERESRRVVMVVPPSRPPTPPLSSPKPASPQPPPEGPDMHPFTVAGLAFSGLAVLGAVVTTVTGIMVLAGRSDLDGQCGVHGDPSACNTSGKKRADELVALANVSTAMFSGSLIAGGLGVGLVVAGMARQGDAVSAPVSTRVNLHFRW